jgi:murein DD-endopeptidase MepM/ murein hydrolase activator NlpD
MTVFFIIAVIIMRNIGRFIENYLYACNYLFGYIETYEIDCPSNLICHFGRFWIDYPCMRMSGALLRLKESIQHMNSDTRKRVSLWWAALAPELMEWAFGWGYFLERHLRRLGIHFEARKDVIVDILMARRGSYQRPFLHISLLLLFISGASAGPILVSAYQGQGSTTDFPPPSAVLTSLDIASSIQTDFSEKPRDQVISYSVKSGDTISTIAQQFGVTIDTIKWANDIQSDSLDIGQKLSIPPVSGIVHKVREGETIYSIAKKYKAEAQNIVNFPFNDFTDPDTFALSIGQTLVVPGGIIPEAAPAYVPQNIAVNVQGTGQFLWPSQGVITQYPSWYHLAFDIANPSGPPVLAADDGVVVVHTFQTFGYGNHVIIDHGNGYQTLYGHMQVAYVEAGQKVSKGQTIGRMGSTGRSTGIHLHFEIRKGGVLLNPAGFFH